MFDAEVATMLIIALLVLLALGVHIVLALGITSAMGIYMVTGNAAVVQSMLYSTAYEGLRDYVFAVIPLFMLMGEFMSRSGAVTDVYAGINRALRRIPGRLGIATILGNAVFSFVTGVSIASAAAFSRIAYPEMKRYGYHRGFALGTIAGSSCLGMLIPPSVLMIVWGILTDRSIGQIFMAGVLPGFLLTVMFVLYVLGTAILSPKTVGAGADAEAADVPPPATDADAAAPGEAAADPADLVVARHDHVTARDVWISSLGIVLVVFTVLGGIMLGWYTPTEGAGVGALIALALAFIKGMSWRTMFDAILAVGRTSAPILVLLIAAALYSRTLAMTGVSNMIQDMFLATGFGPVGILALMVVIWFVLGMIIDSISIMLLTVAMFEPIAVGLGFDPIAFAIVGILAIEAGLLTPPFGLLVFTVKAAIQDTDSTSVMQIFKSSTPYWIMILLTMTAIIIFPGIATILPSLMY